MYIAVSRAFKEDIEKYEAWNRRLAECGEVNAV